MFINNPFKISVDTKQWIKGTTIRCIKTGAEVVGSVVAANIASPVWFIDWKQTLGISATAMLLSFLTCLGGIPEVKASDEEK